MKNLLWLDDKRNPFLNEDEKVPGDIHDWNINWVLDYNQFVKWIEMYGLPDAISFDHDLGYIKKEIWKPIQDYKGIYEVSNYGNVKRIKVAKGTSGGILKVDKTVKGLMVRLRNLGDDRNRSVHRLLAKEFIHNPHNKKCINHKDGNRWNNYISNLEWVTHSENVQHSHNELERFYTAYGENHKNSISVSKYTKSNIYIGTYGSVNEAGRQENIPFTNIAKNARGKRHTAGGFVWKYENKKTTIKSKVKHIKKEDKNYIDRFFIPDYKEQTGEGCAQWLVEYCNNNDEPLPEIFIHSANPVGADKIKQVVEDFEFINELRK